MTIMDFLSRKAKAAPKRIVFPEGSDPNIISAAQRLHREGLVQPVLLGRPEQIQEKASGLGTSMQGIDLIDPKADARLEAYVSEYCQTREMPESVGRRIIRQPLYFGAMMVKAGDAAGLVAGIEHPTEEVIMASELIFGFRPGIGLSSSFFLMEIPGFTGGENGQLILADPAVNPDPNPEELADIAVSTAHSARELFDWEPRVAMLSFSTKGSASHPRVEKVVQAARLAQEKDPGLLIEGELQADSALIPAVADKKIGSPGPVAGKANILIFPDLDAANIGSKLVQRLAGAHSYGPILQGFALPVSDLSRGATVEDIFGAALMVAARST